MSGRSLHGRVAWVSRLHTIGGDIPGALERVNVPSYVVDEHQIIRWLNAAARELVGDVRGRQVTSVVAPEETRRAREAFAKHMVGNEDVDGPVVLIDEHGERVSVEVSSVCLYEGHRVIGVFGQLSDIDVEPEKYKHYFINEIPERFRDKVDVRRFGVGERVVPQPYTQAMLEKTQAWMHARKLFDAPSDGGVSSEHAVDS